MIKKWNWKKSIVMYGATLVALMSYAVKLFENNVASLWPTKGQIVLFTLMGIISIIAAVLTYYSPYKEVERIKLQCWELLGSLIEIPKINNYELLPSIMLSNHFYRQKITGIKPRKDEDFLKVVWEFNHHINTKLKFKPGEGACGIAFSTERAVERNLEAERAKNTNLEEDLNMTHDQVEKTKHVTLIISLPILLPKQGVYGNNRKVIGVINIESSQIGAGAIADNQEQLKEVKNYMNRIAQLYIGFSYATA